MSIEENVDAFKRAKELAEYLDAEGWSEQSWIALRDVALRRAPLPEAPLPGICPMLEADGKKFSREALGFGTFADCSYEHVYNCNADYLDWLADQGMQLLKWLAWRKSKR